MPMPTVANSMPTRTGLTTSESLSGKLARLLSRPGWQGAWST